MAWNSRNDTSAVSASRSVSASGVHVGLAMMLCCVRMVAAAAEPPVTAAAFVPDGMQVLIGSQSGIEFRTWPQLIQTNSLPTDMANVHDLRFSPNGQTLIVAGGSPGEEGSIEIYTWPDRQQIHRIAVHDDIVYRVAWSPDGTQWATASADGTCQCFDSATCKPTSRYEQHSGAVLSICFLPEEERIASVGIDHTVRIWNSASGQHVRTLDNHVDAVSHVVVQPDRPQSESSMAGQMTTLVATISEDRTVRLWQPAIGRLVRFARLPSSPRTLTWSPMGDQLIVACNDGQVHVIDAETMKILNTHDGGVGRVHEILVNLHSNDFLVAGEKGSQRLEIGP